MSCLSAIGTGSLEPQPIAAKTTNEAMVTVIDFFNVSPRLVNKQEDGCREAFALLQPSLLILVVWRGGSAVVLDGVITKPN